MNIDCEKIWKELQADTSSSVPEGIVNVIKICKESMPDSRWDRLNDLDFDTVVEEFEEGFILQLNDIKSLGIRGLYFGITTVILENDECSFALEIGGAKECNHEDEDFGWIFDLSWRGAPIICNALYQTYKYANEENGLGNDLEWPLGLSISVIGIKLMIEKMLNDKRLALPLSVVVGFHDGDMMKIL